MRDQVSLGSEAFSGRLKQSLPLGRDRREVPHMIGRAGRHAGGEELGQSRAGFGKG